MIGDTLYFVKEVIVDIHFGLILTVMDTETMILFTSYIGTVWYQ